MKTRFPGIPFLTAWALVAMSTAAAGAGPVALADDESDVAARASRPGLASCTVSPGAIGTFAFIWTPPEQLTSVAWKIPATSCATCGPQDALNLTSASFRMRWFRACTATAEVSIVGAMAGDSCVLPDPTRILCGPVTRTLTPGGAGNTIYDVPIPSGCCVTGDAFLYVRFTGLGGCASGTGPGLTAAQAPCTNCEQYVTAANIFPTTTEWCSIGATNPMWMSVTEDCCGMTRTRAGSWGAVKTLYR